MQVNGQLERAQLEQVSGPPAGAQPTGRVVADITNPAAAVPIFYDGTQWRQLAFPETPQSLVSQNSGKSCIVDWSQSLEQQVVLTDNCVISFINPQEGKVHKLFVTQSSVTGMGGAGNTYVYVLDMPDQETSLGTWQPNGNALALGVTRTHAWYYKSGLRPGYGTLAANFFTNAAMASPHHGGRFSPDGKAFTAGTSANPFADKYLTLQKQPTVGPLWGIRQLPVPAAAAGIVADAAYSPDSQTLAYAVQVSPFIQAGYVDEYSIVGFFSNPGTLPAGAGNSVDWHPSGNYVGVAHTGAPSMTIYPFQNGYGTKLANPSSLPAGNGLGIAFAPTGDYVTVATSATPFLHTYQFTDSAGNGTIGNLVGNPTSLPPGAPIVARCVAWRPQADYIALAIGTAPYLYVVPFDRVNASYGTPLTVPNGAIAQQAHCVAWTPCGQYLLVGTTTAATTSLYVFDFSSFTIGTPISYDLFPWNTTALYGISIHPSGDYVWLNYSASPWLGQGTLPRKTRNYLKLV